MENSLLKSIILQNSEMLEDNQILAGLMIQKGVKVKQYCWVEYVAA